MPHRVCRSHLVISSIALLCTGMAAQQIAVGQTPQTSIRNFRAVDLSSAVLQVTVDYTYTGGAPQGEVSIHATPEEAGGVFDPRTVDFDELPVQSGTHTVSLTITRREGARDFTSVAVRVCMSTPGRALLCQDFPHQKTWKAVAPPPPPEPPPPQPVPPAPVAPEPAPAAPEPPPPPGRQTCTISGRVKGSRQGIVSPDISGESPARVTLTHMILSVPGSGKALRARIFGSPLSGSYNFREVPAGFVYRLVPGEFRSEPPFLTIECKANHRNVRKDFTILGALQH